MNLPVTQLSTTHLPPADQVLWVQFLNSIDLYARTQRYTYVGAGADQPERKKISLLSVLVEDSSLEVKGFCSRWLYGHLRSDDSEHAAAFRRQHNGAVPITGLIDTETIILDLRGKNKHVGLYFLPITDGIASSGAIYMSNCSKFGTVVDLGRLNRNQRPPSRRKRTG
jgi:hypothetical protein